MSRRTSMSDTYKRTRQQAFFDNPIRVNQRCVSGWPTHLDLVARPAERPIKKLVREARQPLKHVRPPQVPQLLERRVPRPPVDGHLEESLVHVHEPDPLVDLRQPARQDGRAAQLLRRRDQVVGPPGQGSVGVQRPVVAAEVGVDLLRLEPAAWFERGEGLRGDVGLERGPAPGGGACVNVVELVREVPRVGPRCGGGQKSASPRAPFTPPGPVSKVFGGRGVTHASSTKKWTLGGTSSGWMGDRSVPMTVDVGNRSPIWMAQSPTPVATSSTARGGAATESGAR